jgi:multicomponent K+:H+ antiporter subunit E
VKRLLPSPLLSAMLFATWLSLNGSLSAGNLLLAALFAIAIPGFTKRYRPEVPRLKSWRTAAGLAWVVLLDIVKSNVDVARRVLGPESDITPGFFWLPLDLRDPHGIVALASIITLTPGTLSAELSDDRRHLLVHAFDLRDTDALVADIKARYEAPLREIFE